MTLVTEAVAGKPTIELDVENIMSMKKIENVAKNVVDFMKRRGHSRRIRLGFDVNCVGISGYERGNRVEYAKVFASDCTAEDIIQWALEIRQVAKDQTVEGYHPTRIRGVEFTGVYDGGRERD